MKLIHTLNINLRHGNVLPSYLWNVYNKNSHSIGYDFFNFVFYEMQMSSLGLHMQEISPFCEM